MKPEGFMTRAQYEFLNRIYERLNRFKTAEFSQADLFGENPTKHDLARVRAIMSKGVEAGFWSYSVERTGRVKATYRFRPLVKVVFLENK